MHRMRGWGSAGLAVMIVIRVLALLGGFWILAGCDYSVHRNSVRAAFNGTINPSDTARFEFDCPWEGCTDLEWLRRLPAASSVGVCKSGDLFGACCIVDFPGGMSAEIHANKQWTGRWRMSFASHLMCPDPADPRNRRSVVCDYKTLSATSQ